MSEVKVSEHESFEIALKRFNRKIQQDGILAEVRRETQRQGPPPKGRGLAVGHPVWETGRISARLCKPRLD